MGPSSGTVGWDPTVPLEGLRINLKCGKIRSLRDCVKIQRINLNVYLNLYILKIRFPQT